MSGTDMDSQTEFTSASYTTTELESDADSVRYVYTVYSWCQVHCMCSGTFLPMGQKKVSLLVRCPHFRG